MQWFIGISRRTARISCYLLADLHRFLVISHRFVRISCYLLIISRRYAWISCNLAQICKDYMFFYQRSVIIVFYLLVISLSYLLVELQRFLAISDFLGYLDICLQVCDNFLLSLAGLRGFILLLAYLWGFFAIYHISMGFLVISRIFARIPCYPAPISKDLLFYLADLRGFLVIFRRYASIVNAGWGGEKERWQQTMRLWIQRL